MVRRRPRPDTLRDLVLGILSERGEPLTVPQLTELLREKGRTVSPGAVFRAIRDLIDRGAARKIWVARAYAAAPGGFTIGLYCRQCGSLHDADGGVAYAALSSLAETHGFKASIYIVEAPGLCHRCASSI